MRPGHAPFGYRLSPRNALFPRRCHSPRGQLPAFRKQVASDIDANDVVATFRTIMDGKDPNHKGNTGDFYYSYTMWGSLLNPPPPPA